MKAADLIAAMQRKGWRIDTAPWKLNIVGIRTADPRPNRFDDRIVVFYRDESGKWHWKAFAATTDPGTYWLANPLAPQGTAILAEGQYLDTYQIGLHRGKYYALVQRKGPVTVIRDYNRDGRLDFDSPSRFSGYFGINIHRATANGTSTTVDRWSAGCQVLASSRDFETLMQLAEQSKRETGENTFSFSLLDLRDIRRTAKQDKAGRGLILIGMLASGFGLTLATVFKQPQT